jgi:hypothetical protein
MTASPVVGPGFCMRCELLIVGPSHVRQYEVFNLIATAILCTECNDVMVPGGEHEQLLLDHLNLRYLRESHPTGHA